MVPYKATKFLIFQLLYRKKPFMPKELSFMIYKSDEDYEVALSSHIQNMVDINNQATMSNQRVQANIK